MAQGKRWATLVWSMPTLLSTIIWMLLQPERAVRRRADWESSSSENRETAWGKDLVIAPEDHGSREPLDSHKNCILSLSTSCMHRPHLLNVVGAMHSDSCQTKVNACLQYEDRNYYALTHRVFESLCLVFLSSQTRGQQIPQLLRVCMCTCSSSVVVCNTW